MAYRHGVSGIAACLPPSPPPPENDRRGPCRPGLGQAAPNDNVSRAPRPFMVLPPAARPPTAACRTDSITAIRSRRKMLLQDESMPAAHALEAGANRCSEGAGQSLRRKARPRRPPQTPLTCAAPSLHGTRRGARCGAQRHRALHRRPPGRSSPPTAPGPCRPHPPRGAQSCTACRGPFLPRLLLPHFTAHVPNIRASATIANRGGCRPYTDRIGNLVRWRQTHLKRMRSYCAVPGLRYSAVDALHRRPPGRARRGNQPHGFCELPASRRGPGVADRTGPTDKPPETNDR